MFLIYINDLPNVCKVTMPFLFADDTHFFTSGDDLDDMYDTANHELNNIAEWLKVNKLSLNVKKHIIWYFQVSINQDRRLHIQIILKLMEKQFQMYLKLNFWVSS